MKSINQQLGVDVRTVLTLRRCFDLDFNSAEIVGYMLRREYANPECLYTVLYGALPSCQQPLPENLINAVNIANAKLNKHGISIMNVGFEMGWYIAARDKRKMREIMAGCDITPECIDNARGRAFGIVYA